MSGRRKRERGRVTGSGVANEAMTTLGNQQGRGGEGRRGADNDRS